MKKIIPYFLFLIFLPFIVKSQISPKRYYGIRPELIRGPYLQVATPTSIIVRWRTDELDVSFVRYGKEPGILNGIAGNSTRTNDHVVTLTGLEPYTKYYYLVEGFRDTLQWDERNHFTTLPPAESENKYRIGVFGDCGTNSTNQLNTRDQFLKYLDKNVLNAWILVGDNAYSFGKDMEYQTNFFNVYKDILLKQSPLFPAPGNHDYQDEYYSAEFAQRSGEVAYYRNFTMPTKGEAGGVPSNTSSFYSFDIGNIHFLSLDSQGEEDNGTRLFDTTGSQVKWVKRDLEANKNKEWIIAYWHHPPYSMGSHNSDRETQMVKIRQNLIPILERYGVDLVICGHSHSYERSKLMQGHYGLEASFSAEKHLLSNSSGSYDGSTNSCPFVKDSTNRGTIYIVTGSSGRIDYSQTTFPHDALPFSNVTIGGATLLEIEGNRLDMKWICADGVIGDRFTLMKNVNKMTTIAVKRGQSVELKASFVGQYQWEGSNKTTRSITIKPGAGTSVYKVKDPTNCIEDVFTVNVLK
ncbi:MAG TPA: metallophosphoesterase family protein [Chitinophagaceae bacterium]|nr:metallophosphoesterase family protein [Chitinophagaceae bacterium]